MYATLRDYNFLILGDLNAVTSSMLALASLRSDDVTVELTSQEMMSMMGAISNLLAEMNEGSWAELRKEEPNKAVDVMFTIDAYSAIFARQQPISASQSIAMPMLLVEFDVQPASGVKEVTYPRDVTWSNDDVFDSCRVPMETLENVAMRSSGIHSLILICSVLRTVLKIYKKRNFLHTTKLFVLSLFSNNHHVFCRNKNYREN